LNHNWAEKSSKSYITGIHLPNWGQKGTQLSRKKNKKID